MVPMLMTCFGVCILRIIWIFFFIPQNLSVTSILMSYPISWGITGVLFMIYFWFYQKKFFKQHTEQTETEIVENQIKTTR